MKPHILYFKDNKYYLNDYQYFTVDVKLLQEKLDEIVFPCVVLDTEFINASHYKSLDEKIYTKLHDEQIPWLKDIVIQLNYSFAKSFLDIASRNNEKAIQRISLKKTSKQSRSKLYKQYQQSTINFFTNFVYQKHIKSFIFAGKANDELIINTWFDKTRTHFKVKPDILKQETDHNNNNNNNNNGIRAFDIYDILTRCFWFSNSTKTGELFYEPNNLPTNAAKDMLRLTSLKLFFSYFEDYVEYDFNETEDIYNLCVEAYKFYGKSTLTTPEFIHGTNTVKSIGKHCRNDVLKLLTLSQFFYAFLDNDVNNVYVNNLNTD